MPTQCWMLGKYIPLPSTVPDEPLNKQIGQLKEWNALLWCTYRKHMYRSSSSSVLLSTSTTSIPPSKFSTTTTSSITQSNLNVKEKVSSLSPLRLPTATEWQAYFNPTFSDTGYGCTIRSMQSLMINSFLRHICYQNQVEGKNHKGCSKEDKDNCSNGCTNDDNGTIIPWFDYLDRLSSEQNISLYSSIVSYVLDWPSMYPIVDETTKDGCTTYSIPLTLLPSLPNIPSTVFSFQNYLQYGGYKKREGIWWGNYEALYATTQLHRMHTNSIRSSSSASHRNTNLNSFTIYLATDGIVVKETLYHYARSLSSSSSSSGPWRPVLLLIPVRLGYQFPITSSFNLLQSIDYMRLPSFMGALGGRPRHSCYLIGIVSYSKEQSLVTTTTNDHRSDPPSRHGNDNVSTSTSSLSSSFRLRKSSASALPSANDTHTKYSRYYSLYNYYDHVLHQRTTEKKEDSLLPVSESDPMQTNTEYKVIYLDPHTTNVCPNYSTFSESDNSTVKNDHQKQTSDPASSSAAAAADAETSAVQRPTVVDPLLQSYRASLRPPSSAWLMNLEDLDPSMSLAYYFRTENEYKHWLTAINTLWDCYRAKKTELECVPLKKDDKEDTHEIIKFLFEIVDTPPNFEYTGTSNRSPVVSTETIPSSSTSNASSLPTTSVSSSESSLPASSSSSSTANKHPTEEWEIL